ncbi:putative SWEET sugar transporter [Lupinus albus]|uniref:Putative SWEET sugar transporter n=1 Tax=Lupinus albus TaxID=3870 RepID=A0A6A4PTM3_LUPAL|nr:putative SWEET sugar transporter [Lupinus albus]
MTYKINNFQYLPQKFTIKLFLAMNVRSFALILLVTLFAMHDGPLCVKVLGLICVSISIITFAAPLNIVINKLLEQLVLTRSVDCMPFYLSFTLILSGITWFGYGFVLKYIFIIVSIHLTKLNLEISIMSSYHT